MSTTINTKHYIILAIVALSSAFIGAAVFAGLVRPSELVLEEAMERGRLVAEDQYYQRRERAGFAKINAPSDFIAAANDSKVAVVHVRSLVLSESSTVFNRVYNSSSGSGVLISRDGYIVTNKHVIEGANKIEIILNDNREYIATLVGSDVATDLAVLKIPVSDAPYLRFGNSDELQIGEWVMAIGNPFKLSSTVTAGIVSAKARSIDVMGSEGIESFIQTDAAVNPGNSGGALVNTEGLLVGINTAILTQTGRYEGFSFAVPINLARKVIADIQEFGAVQRGWLGVKVNSVNADIAEDIGLPNVSGVLLSGFTQGSAAKEGGMQIGDVIIGVNDQEVGSVPEFTEQVGRYRPGDQLKLRYLRSNGIKIANITLKNNLNTTDFIAVRKDKVLVDLGFEIRDMDSVEKQTLDRIGAYVVSVYHNSIIGNTNLEPGFIVTKANQSNIESASDLVDFLNKTSGKIVLEGYYGSYPGKYPYTFEHNTSDQ